MVLVSGGFLCPNIWGMGGQRFTTMQVCRSELAVLVLLPPATISGDGIAAAGRPSGRGHARPPHSDVLPIPTSFPAVALRHRNGGPAFSDTASGVHVKCGAVRPMR